MTQTYTQQHFKRAGPQPAVHEHICVFPFTLKIQQSFADELHLQLHLAVIRTSYTDKLMLIREEL